MADFKRADSTTTTTGWWRGATLPGDVLQASAKRLKIVALVAAVVFAYLVIMQQFVRPVLVSGPAAEAMQAIWPDSLIAAPGASKPPADKNAAMLFKHTLVIVLSLVMVVVAWRSRVSPRRLLDIGLAYQVGVAFLAFGLWRDMRIVGPDAPWRVLLTCLWILMFAMIVPNTPRKTLFASVACACVPYVAFAHGLLRGYEYMLPNQWSVVLAVHSPGLVAAGVAVVGSLIVTQLGRQISKARELGSYRLVDKLGEGGMGEVWKAEHQMLARPAAVKLVRPDMLRVSPDVADKLLHRFEREAQATAQLQSPHSIQLFDYGIADNGTFYYVMELLDGLDLATLVKRTGPVPAARAAQLLRQACHSLQDAHDQGLIHRDIKPANVFACRKGRDLDFVKVLDFGLVRGEGPGGGSDVTLTEVNTVTGTPAFMAPEMAVGGAPIDGRSDLYALGCVGYWLVTGQLVFDGDNALAVLMRHTQEEPTPPSQRTELEIPPGFDAVILRALAKQPQDRYVNAAAMAAALDDVLDGLDPWSHEQARRWWDTHAPAGQASETDAPTVDVVLQVR